MTNHLTPIIAAYERIIAAAIKHTPGGVLLPADMPHLIRATACDTGRSVADVSAELERHYG